MNGKMNMLAVLLVVVQLTSVWAGSYGGGEEVAPFTLLEKKEKYEIRTYPSSNWVCYDHAGSEFPTRHQANSFFALFDYLNGENSEGININMTAPTTVNTVLSADSQGQNLFRMCLYLPQIHQENPPAPNEEGVFILNRPKITVAVRQFPSFMMKEDAWEVQMELLKNDLMSANEPGVDYNDMFGAAFDPPFKPNGRHNEVWFVKKE